ncbi:MAG: phosphatidylserine decarboxylase family protein [Gemmataceae bacterium]
MPDVVPDRPASPPPAEPAPLETMDPQLKWIQPGGGIICHLELAWGYVRRAWLKTFRPGYVRRMAELRKGTFNGCPHEVLDPRDVKFYRNQGGYYWEPKDDPFQYRERLPFVRVGLAELFVMTPIVFAFAALMAWSLVRFEEAIPTPVRYFGWALFIFVNLVGLSIVWFFRNPPRTIPTDPGLVVSPADGKVVAIEEIKHDPFIGGPAVQIGIFLSVFNVHINRTPVAGRVVGLTYRKGKFLNAMRPESSRLNEQLAVRIQETQFPYRRYTVRQITGAIARRIVCWLKPGDELSRGEQFGMIKLGSRTELVIPREAGMKLRTKLGDKVSAGTTVLAEFGST